MEEGLGRPSLSLIQAPPEYPAALSFEAGIGMEAVRFWCREPLRMLALVVALSMVPVLEARASQIGIGGYEASGVGDAGTIAKFQSEFEKALREAGIAPVSLAMQRPCPDIGCWAARARAQGVQQFILVDIEGFRSSGFVVTAKVYEVRRGSQLFREKTEIPDSVQSELLLTRMVSAIVRQIGGGSAGSDPSAAKRKSQVRVLGIPPGRGVLLNNIPLSEPDRPLTVEPGRQRLVISAGDGAKSREFDVLPGEMYTLEFTSLDDMQAIDPASLAAVLELRSLPTDARVRLDGTDLPNQATHEITAGAHTLVIERLGYEKMELPFRANPGQQVLVPVALVPLGGPVPAQQAAQDPGLRQRVGLLPVTGSLDGILQERVMDAARYAGELAAKVQYVSPEQVAAALGMEPARLASENQKCVTGLCTSKLLKPAALARYVDIRVRQSGPDWVVRAVLYSTVQGERVDGIEIPYGGSSADLPWIVFDAVRHLLGDADMAGMTRIEIPAAAEDLAEDFSVVLNGAPLTFSPDESGRQVSREVTSGQGRLAVTAGGETAERRIWLRTGVPFVLELAASGTDGGEPEPAIVRPPPPSPASAKTADGKSKGKNGKTQKAN